MDAHGNYVKKSRRVLEQPKLEGHEEPKEPFESEAQPRAPPVQDQPAPTPPAPPVPVSSDTQFVILEELIHFK